MPWSKFLNNIELKHSCKNETDRMLSYSEAIRESLDYALQVDNNFFIMGQGVDDPSGMFGATLNLHKKYGSERVFDTPLSENALTGIAVGAAISGMRPFYCHNRPDFLLITMDQIVNHASKWNYMFGGNSNVPLVIWTVTARGWGSAAQHSQALQGLFMHVPGLKIVMPTTPYDAKGLVTASIADNNPVIIMEHRWLFNQKGYVPEEAYSIPLGKGIIRKEGTDVTIVSFSYMVVEALKASEELENRGISVEVIDLRTLKPFDEELILESVKKTGRVIVTDTGWKTGGASAEICATIAEKAFEFLKKPLIRVACEDVPTPASYSLENEFYKDSTDIINAVLKLIK